MSFVASLWAVIGLHMGSCGRKIRLAGSPRLPSWINWNGVSLKLGLCFWEAIYWSYFRKASQSVKCLVYIFNNEWMINADQRELRHMIPRSIFGGRLIGVWVVAMRIALIHLELEINRWRKFWLEYPNPSGICLFQWELLPLEEIRSIELSCESTPLDLRSSTQAVCEPPSNKSIKHVRILCIPYC